jgi:hypothetical protein
MSALQGWRRLAVKLARHAALALPGARSPWAEAMRRELDYIENDRAALRWAFGCVLASYKARLAAGPSCRTRDLLRQAAACGAVMLVIGLAFLENAGGRTEPLWPTPDKGACDTRSTAADTGQMPPSGAAGIARNADRPVKRPEGPCADPPPEIRAPLASEPSRGESR